MLLYFRYEIKTILVDDDKNTPVIVFLTNLRLLFEPVHTKNIKEIRVILVSQYETLFLDLHFSSAKDS